MTVPLTVSLKKNNFISQIFEGISHLFQWLFLVFLFFCFQIICSSDFAFSSQQISPNPQNKCSQLLSTSILNETDDLALDVYQISKEDEVPSEIFRQEKRSSIGKYRTQDVIFGYSKAYLENYLDAIRVKDRQSYIEKYEHKISTSPTENQIFVNFALEQAPEQKNIYFQVENSKMKELNNLTNDHALVTSLTNQYEEIIIANITKMILLKFPEIRILTYSDYKGIRMIFKMSDGTDMPEHLKHPLLSELNSVYRLTYPEFEKAIKEAHIFRTEDPIEEWFRAGIGETAEEANIASRMARKQEVGKVNVLRFSDPNLNHSLEKHFEEIEIRRNIFQNVFGFTLLAEEIKVLSPKLEKKTPTLKFIPIFKAKVVPTKKVFELCRKSKTPESLLNKLKSEFGNSLEYKEALNRLSIEDAKNIFAYVKMVDEFSPSVYQINRDIVSFSEATVNGVSSDFVGMGALNLNATAKALARSKNINEALTEIRKEERLVTKTFEIRKNEYAKLIRHYLKNKKHYDFELICSGDDCIISVPDQMSPVERKGLVNYIARNSKYTLPSEVRMSFIPSGIKDATQKGVLSSIGEFIEKTLRENLRGQGVNRKKLEGLTFATEMKSPKLNLIRVALLMGLRKDIKLEDNEIIIIQNAFDKTVQQLQLDSEDLQSVQSQYTFFTELSN